MRTEKLRLLGLWLIIAAVLPAYQNCSPGLHALEPIPNEIFQSTADCMEKGSGACLFDKNAVSTARRAVTAEDVGGYQMKSVEIADLDGSGYLQNADLQVVTSQTERMKTSSGLRHYYSATDSKAEQLMAYYYSNLVRRWMKSYSKFPSAGLATKIVVDSSFNGWVPSKNEIHLQRDQVKLPAAFDASLIVSLYLQSQIWAASGGDSHNRLTAKTQTCKDANGLSAPGLCCTSAVGCGPALVNGASDFLVAHLFEDQGTAVGDGWKNDPAGQVVCGLPRDAAKVGVITAGTASAACSSRGATASVHALGLVYASIWWELREKAANQAQLERFFLSHLALISGDDDFATIKTKLLSLDQSEFSGQFANSLNAAFAKREL